MTDAKLHYYPWYPRHFMADEPVIAMSLEAEGAYRRLLDHQWLHLTVPTDLTVVARICKGVPLPRMRKLWTEIAVCFPSVEGDPTRLQNRRLERIRQEMQAKREKRSQSGKKGAEVRWQDDSTEHGIAIGLPMRSDAIQSQIPKSKTNTKVVVDEALTLATRTVTGKLNRGMTDNPLIGNHLNPVTASAGTQVVADWLRDGIPVDFAAEEVYQAGLGFKPRDNDRQIGSLNYLDRRIRKAWDRQQSASVAQVQLPKTNLPKLPRITA